ncbi:Arrestin (or S-antigen), C-terminal domain [Nakaseomyces glabratus]
MTSPDQELLFDIQVDNDRDGGVVLLKGCPDEAASVLLSGNIMLSVKEPIRIKNLSLKLCGKLKLRLPDTNNKRERYYRKVFFEHEWNSFDIHGCTTSSYNSIGPNGSLVHGANDDQNKTMKSLVCRGAKSTTSLHNMAFDSTSSKYYTLIKGNYELPFNIVLPGTLPESIEGIPGVLLTYNLIANLEQTNPTATILCQKHLRVIRTLSADAVELSESVLFTNTWPKKVEYSISVPTKAVAIGSTTPVNILLVPLLKGLKLGSIRMTLIEKYSYGSKSDPKQVEKERKVTQMKIRNPLKELARNVNFQDDEDNSEFKDSWDLQAYLKIPPDLMKCSPDCFTLERIKCRHQIKVVASLINPDNHISELRATLSIQLYVSPYIELFTKPYNSLYVTVEGDENSLKKEHRWSSTPFNQDDRKIFMNSGNNAKINCTSFAHNRSMNGLMAPPNYEMHFYDKLCHDTPVEGSALHSPIHMTNDSIISNEDSLHKLDGTLRDLHLEDRDSDYYSNMNGLSLPTSAGEFNKIDEIQELPSDINLSYFSNDYILKDRDAAKCLSQSSKDSNPDLRKFSRVPSYDMAVLTPTIDEELPPVYSDNPSPVVNTPQSRTAKSFTHEKHHPGLHMNLARCNSAGLGTSRPWPKSTSPVGKGPLVNMGMEFNTLQTRISTRSRSRTVHSVANEKSSSPLSLSPRQRSTSFVSIRNILNKR